MISFSSPAAWNCGPDCTESTDQHASMKERKDIDMDSFEFLRAVPSVSKCRIVRPSWKITISSTKFRYLTLTLPLILILLTPRTCWPTLMITNEDKKLQSGNLPQNFIQTQFSTQCSYTWLCRIQLYLNKLDAGQWFRQKVRTNITYLASSIRLI